MRNGINWYVYAADIPNRAVDPFGDKWHLIDWIKHYFFEGGHPVDLRDIGLLGDLRAELDAKGYTASYESTQAEAMRAKAKEWCGRGDRGTSGVLDVYTDERVFHPLIGSNLISLFQRALSVTRNNATAHYNLACALARKGDLYRRVLPKRTTVSDVD